VAEGVETPAQLHFLRQHQCETYQGWLYAKAIPAAELDTLLGLNEVVKPLPRTQWA